MMEKNLKVMMLLNVVENSPDLQRYFADAKDDEMKQEEAFAEIYKWYGLSKQDLEDSRRYFDDYFGGDPKLAWWRWF